MNIDLEDFDISLKIHDILIKLNKTVSTAESCTCGRIAATLACVPEAALYVQGGLAAYLNEVKIEYLGVPAEMIDTYDVVSKQVVTLMVKGACDMFHTDFAIASTGYAGRGHDEFYQGMIWLGWGTKDDVHTIMLSDNAGKEYNTLNAEKVALTCFYRYLKKLYVYKQITNKMPNIIKNAIQLIKDE